MKKTILQYMTDIYQEDIPKHILQENKIRLNSFFLEQESVQKKGTQFIFRYAFYSVEKPRKITKQHLLKEYGLSGNIWLVSFKISYLCLPLFYETRTTPSCHPSGCAYRQL